MALAVAQAQIPLGAPQLPFYSPSPSVTPSSAIHAVTEYEDASDITFEDFEIEHEGVESPTQQKTEWQWLKNLLEFFLLLPWTRPTCREPIGRLHPKITMHQLSKSKLEASEIPQYVIDYAPLVHLYSEEEFWPCHILEHLQHTTAYVNYTQVDGDKEHRTLKNLDELNEHHRFAYLTSDDNVEDRPTWLGGKVNIPEVPDKGSQNPGGRSDAPVTLVVVDKGRGIIDAFWFFFYSYNQGNSVFRRRFGNHVGDW